MLRAEEVWTEAVLPVEELLRASSSSIIRR